MNKERLQDIFDFLPKSRIKAGEGQEEGTYPFYTSSRELTKYVEQAIYPANCLIFGTGGKASIHFSEIPFSTSTDCIVIKPKDDKKLSAQYVYQYIKANIGLLEKGFKGAGLKHISKSYIANLIIPLCSHLDQQRIVYLLSKVEKLILQRKQSLLQLDELIKSIFIKMFKNNNPNVEKWPLVTIESLASYHKGSMRTGPFGSNLLHSEFKSEGDVAVLGIDNAVQNKFCWGESRYINLKKYEELKNYRVYPDDIIITIMGTVGRSAVIPQNIPLAINTKHLAAITLNKEEANPKFISFSIHSDPYIINQFKRRNRGAIMSGLNLTIIKATKLKKPPLELQNKFALLLDMIDSLKEKYLSNLINLENLYNNLCHKAFKDELDLTNIPTAIKIDIEAGSEQHIRLHESVEKFIEFQKRIIPKGMKHLYDPNSAINIANRVSKFTDIPDYSSWQQSTVFDEEYEELENNHSLLNDQDIQKIFDKSKRPLSFKELFDKLDKKTTLDLRHYEFIKTVLYKMLANNELEQIKVDINKGKKDKTTEFILKFKKVVA